MAARSDSLSAEADLQSADVRDFFSDSPNVSKKSETFQYQIAETIQRSHVDYPARLRSMNWKHATTSKHVTRILEHTP